MRSAVFAVTIATVAIAIALFQNLSPERKWPLKKTVLSPVGTLLHVTGLWKKLLFRSVDGWLYPAHQAPRVPLVPQFETKKGDVVVVTWPRSGTHFAMLMILDILQRGLGTFDDMNEIAYSFEGVAMLNPFEDYRPLPRSGDPPVRGRIIGTHINAETVPYSKDAIYIVLMRDPVECLRSMCKMLQSVFGPVAPPEKDFFLWIASQSKGWAEWTLTWWKRSMEHPENVHFMYYSEMIKDLSGHLVKLSKILDFPLNQEEIDRVVQRSSFEYATTHVRTGRPVMTPFSPPDSERGFLYSRGQSPIDAEQERTIRRDYRKRLGIEPDKAIWKHLGIPPEGY